MAKNKVNTNNPKTKPNHVYAILCVAFVLFLMGLFGLVLIHANKLVSYFRENVTLMVEIKESATDAEVQSFNLFLESAKFTKPGSLLLITKEKAAEIMKQDFGDDLELLGSNPFFDSFNFNLNPKYINKDSLSNLIEGLRTIEIVREAYYPEELSFNISRLIRQLAIITAILSFLILLIAIFLIDSTVKLSLFSNRFLIRNMQLVGAPWGFIRRPYMRRSLINGVISSLLAIGGLIAITVFLRFQIPELEVIQETSYFVLLFLVLLVAGISLSWISTRWGVNKYLKMRLDELY